MASQTRAARIFIPRCLGLRPRAWATPSRSRAAVSVQFAAGDKRNLRSVQTVKLTYAMSALRGSGHGKFGGRSGKASTGVTADF
jgi:hypothetical protein